MNEIMKKIKGRHWVFIVGFIMVTIMSFSNTDVAIDMIELLLYMGIGIALCRY